MNDQAEPLRPLRVALVITELNVGGAERCLTNLAEGLDRTRFAPTVISLAPRPTGPQMELVERLQQAGIPTHFLDLRSSREFLSGVKRLERLFAQASPDVVQTFLVHANVLGAVAARRAGVKSIATGIRVADPRRRRLWLERFAASRAARAVCVSQATADVMASRGRIDASKVIVIPNGIDVSRFDAVPPVATASLGIEPGRRIIAVVGRLEKQKGLNWLLAAAPQLLSKTPSHDLVLIGDGPQRNELTAEVSRLGLADRVHFAGWRPDVPAILAASDLLLLPSRWEGMPNVILEAMASRLPVLATRSEGVSEVLGDAVDAQTINFGDSQALVDKAVAFTSDSSLAGRLSSENRIRVENHFSIQAMVASYQALFEELASRNSVK